MTKSSVTLAGAICGCLLNGKIEDCNNPATRASSVMPALPVMAVVFLSFIIIGMALPVLPLQSIREGLSHESNCYV